jgi:hypothetical protein
MVSSAMELSTPSPPLTVDRRVGISRSSDDEGPDLSTFATCTREPPRQLLEEG